MEDYEALAEENSRLRRKVEELEKPEDDGPPWPWEKFMRKCLVGLLVACGAGALAFGFYAISQSDSSPITCYEPYMYTNEAPWSNRWFVMGKGAYHHHVSYSDRFPSREAVIQFMHEHNLPECK